MESINTVSQAWLRRNFSYDEVTGSLIDIRFGRLPANRKSRYVLVRVASGRWFNLHQLVWLYFNGTIPSGFYINAKDGNPHNTHISNLRLADRSQISSASKMYANNKTGYRGVYYTDGKFRVKITKDSVAHFLGEYDSAEQAHIAFQAEASKLHGEFAGPDTR